MLSPAAAGGPPPRPTWSWRRGLGHAALVLALVVAAGVIVVLVGGVKDPRRFGEGLGRFAIAAMLAALGISWLAQTGRKTAAWAAGLGAAAVIGAVAAAVVISLENAALRLSPGERADLALVNTDDQRWLEHPVLGFAVRHPGPSFEPAPAVSAALAGQDADEGMATWGFIDATTGEALAVMAVKGIDTREELNGFLRGFRESLGRAGATIEREDVVWSDERREVRLELGLAAGGARVAIRGLGAPLGPDRAPFLVAVLATTDDPARATTLVESLRLR